MSAWLHEYKVCIKIKELLMTFSVVMEFIKPNEYPRPLGRGYNKEI